MAIGPVEYIIVGFPGNKFNGQILPELGKLVDDEQDFIDYGDGPVDGASSSEYPHWEPEEPSPPKPQPARGAPKAPSAVWPTPAMTWPPTRVLARPRAPFVKLSNPSPWNFTVGDSARAKTRCRRPS